MKFAGVLALALDAAHETWDLHVDGGAIENRDRSLIILTTPEAQTSIEVELVRNLQGSHPAALLAAADRLVKKASDGPSVEDAAEILRRYYRLPRRSNGGAVHIILEDGNVQQSHADWCVENAPKWAAEFGGDELLAEDLRVARMLARMSRTQRVKLSHMSFYPAAS
jgi:hypothetical protein